MTERRRYHITEALLQEMETGIRFEPGTSKAKKRESRSVIRGKGDTEDADTEYNFPPRFMSKRELHKELNIPRETVKKCIEQGKVKETKFPGSKVSRFWAPSVEKTIKEHNRKK